MNRERRLFFMHCFLCLFPISLLEQVFKWLFYIGFFSFGRQKKVVAVRVKQVVILYSNNCTGIRWGGLSIGSLRQVVVL